MNTFKAEKRDLAEKAKSLDGKDLLQAMCLAVILRNRFRLSLRKPKRNA